MPITSAAVPQKKALSASCNSARVIFFSSTGIFNSSQISKTVALVMGPDPSKKDCDCYGCYDKINSKSDTTYYRVKHVDSNGVFDFSSVKMIGLK